MIATQKTASAPALNGLHPSGPERLPFAPSLTIRAFVLERSRGNLLVYSTSDLDSAEQWLRDLGGVDRQYLNHGHEAMFAPRALDAPVFVHEADRDSVDGRLHVRASFSRRHNLDEDFDVIPTPGHTPGATAYLWDNSEHRFLFTGDTIYLVDGEWRAGLLESSDRTALLDSLLLIRELDFDVLVPWAATAGRPFVAHTDAGGTRKRIDALIDGIWRRSP